MPKSLKFILNERDSLKLRETVFCKLIDISPTILCGQANCFCDPTIITCITGSKELYYEILFLYLTNYKLRNLRCLVILSKDEG